ncbi:hypothetical protein DID88_005886 [Monilinia fructigena]|uniref:CPAF-like PDZ domain-containing protein n=1 Tax=Monilinia fructigena TaxID=38457 RepID=A0A395J293_9HELO|nr:hypothetical protein DID88_005886 [Monilinia fructigena]
MPSSNMALLLAALVTLPYNCMASTTTKYVTKSGHSSTAAISTAAPTASVSASASATATRDACGIVSSLSALAVAATPSAIPKVDAELAHECLNSVPLNKTAAIQFVTGLEPYIEWQSDLADLKDPPEDYFYPSFDVFAKLASVKSNLEEDVYANEYEFQQDLYQVFTPAHDGHFVVYPDLLTAAFEWRRRRSLVSISSDGVEVPKIYLYEDIISAPKEARLGPPGLFQSRRRCCIQYHVLREKHWSQQGLLLEDTLQLVVESDTSTQARTLLLVSRMVQLLVTPNYADVKGDFTGVTDGESFYQQFCVPAPVDSTNDADATPTTQATPAAIVTATGYPTLEPGFEDVAVLSLLAFESESIAEFQAVTQTFLADAVRDGKTKLIVDLQGNAGGYILQGYDEFRQLFPHIVQDGNTKMRESEGFLTIAKIFSKDIPADYDPNTASDTIISEYQTWFNYRFDYNLTNQPFLTYEDKFAPHAYKGDNYTNFLRWNLNNPMTTTNTTYGLGIEVSGYGSLSNLTQPFAAENIVMIYDGFCASTCTIFSEFMRIQGGVKSIAFGGRPSSGAIQGVGGIKGAQVTSFADIYAYAQVAAASPNATPEDLAILNRLTSFPVDRSTAASINLRDAILPDHLNDGLPSQYVVEEADCKLYWTADMIKDVEKVWEAAATAAWGGGACIAGAGLSNEKRDVESKKSKTKEKKPVINIKRDRNTLAIKKENLEKDVFWTARHGTKVVL